MIYDLNIEQDKKQAMLKFEAFSDKGVVIELKEKMKNRTLSQNAYLHVLFGLYGCAFGYTLRESKTFLKRECPFMRYKKNTDVFLRSTASLDKIEMIEFIDWIRTYASLHEYYLPTADEYLENQTYIDKELAKNKEFL